MLSQGRKARGPASPELELEAAYWTLVDSFHYLFAITLISFFLSHLFITILNYPLF